MNRSIKNERFLEIMAEVSGITTEKIESIIRDAIMETMPLPSAELERRKKEREKDTQDRERDNERRMKQVRQAQADAIRAEQDDCEDDDYPLLASPKIKEDNPYHDENGHWSSKKDSTCYSFQWKDGSISRMKGRKAVPRKGGVGRKTASGGKGKHLCKTGKVRE